MPSLRTGVEVQITKSVTAQLGVQTLPAEAQHVRSRGPIVAREFERGFDAQTLDDVGQLPDQILQSHAADELRQLLDRPGKLAPALTRKSGRRATLRTVNPKHG